MYVCVYVCIHAWLGIENFWKAISNYKVGDRKMVYPLYPIFSLQIWIVSLNTYYFHIKTKCSSSTLLKGSGLDNHWDRLSFLGKPPSCYFLFYKKWKARTKEGRGSVRDGSWSPSRVLLPFCFLIIQASLAKSYSLVSMLGMKRVENSKEACPLVGWSSKA